MRHFWRFVKTKAVLAFVLIMLFGIRPLAAQKLVIDSPELITNFVEYPDELLSEMGVKSMKIERSMKRKDEPMIDLYRTRVIHYNAEGGKKKEVKSVGRYLPDSVVTNFIYHNGKVYREIMQSHSQLVLTSNSFPKSNVQTVKVFQKLIQEPAELVEAMAMASGKPVQHYSLENNKSGSYEMVLKNDIRRDLRFTIKKIRYLDNGKIDWLEYRNDTGQKFSKLVYVYDTEGRVERLEHYEVNHKAQSFLYTYGKSNIAQIDQFEGAKKKYTYEYFFGNNGLLRSVLRYTPNKDEMLIIDYRYTFFKEED